MNFMEKTRNKLVHVFFPFAERFYPFLSLVLLVAAWSVPETYWQIRIVFFWLWLVHSEIHWAGAMERDYLPIQPGSSLFYHIYRFIDRAFFLFLLIWLVIMLIPEPLWLRSVFSGVFIMAVLLRAIGERKYRPKKPEE
ncbi:hypothetical protein [Caproiciproducens galactitolivorans]|uniref:hypothetical protein n=1 Tax=Caproiciproducens galactitolivorans TaxID=642589 RepID=UPI00227AC3E6|nr:hypothetical protein [Caproiciproducens galactitolivorans]